MTAREQVSNSRENGRSFRPIRLGPATARHITGRCSVNYVLCKIHHTMIPSETFRSTFRHMNVFVLLSLSFLMMRSAQGHGLGVFSIDLGSEYLKMALVKVRVYINLMEICINYYEKRCVIREWFDTKLLYLM